MKKSVIITSLVILGAGLLAMSFVSSGEEMCERQEAKFCCQTNTHTKEELVDALPVQEKELFYVVRGNYEKPISKQKLVSAARLSDFIDYYPANWIKHYKGVEITANRYGDKKTEFGVNDKLTKGQRQLLAASSVGTTIDVKVKYKKGNAIGESEEDREMNISMSLIPEIEARCGEGNEKLISYLKEETKGRLNLTKIDNAKVEGKEIEFPGNIEILFVIDKKGKVQNVRIENSSNDEETDNLVLDVIKSMPNWIPATNAKGDFVEQEFLFSVGEGGGC